MNNSMTISVICKDEETKARYEVLAAKMREDVEFATNLKLCKNEEDIFALYKKSGYTDLPYQDFVVQFKETMGAIAGALPEGTFELTETELDNVVGGFDFFAAMVSAIPIAGPMVFGIKTAVDAFVLGEGALKVFEGLAVGIAGAAIDLTIQTLTGGVGSLVTTPLVTGAAAALLKMGATAAKTYVAGTFDMSL